MIQARLQWARAAALDAGPVGPRCGRNGRGGAVIAGDARREVLPSPDRRLTPSGSRGAAESRRAMSDTERAAAAHADPSGIGALRSILRIRPFRRLWLVLGVASLGDWLGLLATSIFAADQVSDSTAKGVAFGGVIAVRLLPALVLGPIAGVLADRFDRRLHDGRLRPDPVRAVRLDPGRRAVHRQQRAGHRPGPRSPPSWSRRSPWSGCRPRTPRCPTCCPRAGSRRPTSSPWPPRTASRRSPRRCCWPA